MRFLLVFLYGRVPCGRLTKKEVETGGHRRERIGPWNRRGQKTTIGGMVFKKKKSRSVVQRATFDHGGSFKVILGIRIQWREVEIGGNDSGKLTLSFVRTEIVR